MLSEHVANAIRSSVCLILGCESPIASSRLRYAKWAYFCLPFDLLLDKALKKFHNNGNVVSAKPDQGLFRAAHCWM
jgi:hypothetical protein